jgi:hypothetical protein
MAEKNIIEPRNYKSLFVALTVLFGLLTALMTFMWSVSQGEVKTLQGEVTKLKEEKKILEEMVQPMLGENATDDLQTDLENLLKDFETIKKEGRPEDQAAIQAEADKAQRALDELKEAKRQGRVSAGTIAKLTAENNTLREIMRGYVKQIDELNTKNLELNTNLEETKVQLSETSTERDEFKQKATDSEEKVKKGQRLQAYSIASFGLREKLNNDLEATTKARNCVQAEVKFTLGANELTESGTKSIFVQIIDPDGKSLQGRTGGSTATENGNITYGMKRDVNYANKVVDVNTYFDFNGEEPVKGQYKVKIYCGQELIGQDSFSLK